MRWLDKLLGRCQHKWKVVGSGRVRVYDESIRTNEECDKSIPNQITYTRELHCEKCGDVAFKRFSP